MTITYNRLAAARPAALIEQDFYALTSGEVIGVIHVCNQDAAAQTFSIAVTDAGTGVAATGEDWIEYDTAIPANTTFKITLEGFAATSTIRIIASKVDVISFVLFGMLKT